MSYLEILLFSRPVGISTRNFKPKRMGMGDKMIAPEAKQAKANKPQINNLSIQMNIKRKRTSLLDFCQRILRTSLRSSGVRKRPWLPTGMKIVDIFTLYNKWRPYGK